MKTLYTVTCKNKDGLRTMIHARQGRFMKETREAAEEELTALLRESEERLIEVFGEQSRGTFRVDAYECYDHGDPVGAYVNEGDEA